MENYYQFNNAFNGQLNQKVRKRYIKVDRFNVNNEMLECYISPAAKVCQGESIQGTYQGLKN